MRQRKPDKSVEEIVRELKQTGKTSSNDYREQQLRTRLSPKSKQADRNGSPY